MEDDDEDEDMEDGEEDDEDVRPPHFPSLKRNANPTRLSTQMMV